VLRVPAGADAVAEGLGGCVARGAHDDLGGQAQRRLRLGRDAEVLDCEADIVVDGPDHEGAAVGGDPFCGCRGCLGVERLEVAYDALSFKESWEGVVPEFLLL